MASGFSFDSYDGDGSTTDFTVSFAYLQESHVEVLVDGAVQSDPSDYEFINPSTIRFDTAPADGSFIYIHRKTSRGTRLVDYTSPSQLSEEDLDDDSLQAFYIGQEAIDEVTQRALRKDDADDKFDAESKVIKNVADGAADNDAANFSQLNDVIVGGNGVPNPEDPTDDDKALVASGGTFDWVSNPKTVIAKITDLASFMATFLGSSDKSTARQNLDLETTVDVAAAGDITSSGLTQATDRLLGRTTASSGAIEEISVGNGLDFSGGSIAASISASLLRGFKSGIVPSNNGIDADHDLDFTAGAAVALDGSDSVEVSALTKQLDASFAEGDAAGALGDTVSLPTSGTIHLFAIKKDADGTGDILADTDIDGTNVPLGWTVIRRIGSWTTDGSANLYAMKVRELSGGGLEQLYETPLEDVNVTDLGTSATLYTLTVPTDIKVKVPMRTRITQGTSGAEQVLVTSPDQADQAPSLTGAGLFNVGGSIGSGTGQWGARLEIQTNTSAQVRARASSASTDFDIRTEGWYDELRT